MCVCVYTYIRIYNTTRNTECITATAVMCGVEGVEGCRVSIHWLRSACGD